MSAKPRVSGRIQADLFDNRIMFLREYQVIDSATTVEKLRMRLKDSEIEQYGDAFIPEYVYEVIRRLPRFSSMRVSQRFPKQVIS